MYAYICVCTYAYIYTHIFLQKDCRERYDRTQIQITADGVPLIGIARSIALLFSTTFTTVTYFYPCHLMDQVSDLAHLSYKGGN